MDDTPKAFLEELRNSVLKKRVGQIALAIILAQAAWQFLRAMVWYLVIPIIGKTLEGHTESVFLKGPTRNPIPWDNLFGSLLQFLLTIIAVFYLNRWIHRRKPQDAGENLRAENGSVGESLHTIDASQHSAEPGS